MGHGMHVVNGSTAYTTSDDFCRIFSAEMDGLYLLALLLTGDAGKAEQCFVAGIGNCVEGNAVFREWARSWARRSIVVQAIQAIAPAKGAQAVSIPAPPELDPALQVVFRLDVLERFVYVMSVLEGFSHQDCAILLGVSRPSVVSARARAIGRLASQSTMMQTEEIQTAYASVSH